MAPNFSSDPDRPPEGGTLILAKRGVAPPHLKTLYVALISAGFIFFLSAIFLLAYFSLDTNVFGYLTFGLLFLVLALISLAVSLSVILRAGMNEDIISDPIVYDEREDKLILTSLGNKKIVIAPSMLKRVSYGISVDYFFFLTYGDAHNKKHRVNLGFVMNPDAVEERLKSLKEKR